MAARFVTVDHDTSLLLLPDMWDLVASDRMVHFVMVCKFLRENSGDKPAVYAATKRQKHGRRVADLQKKDDPPPRWPGLLRPMSWNVG